MKIILFVIVALLIGCSHVPNSLDYMGTCRKLCRGKVQHYQDDTVECKCIAGGSDVTSK